VNKELERLSIKRGGKAKEKNFSGATKIEFGCRNASRQNRSGYDWGGIECHQVRIKRGWGICIFE
jgi:hypothetical protein